MITYDVALNKVKGLKLADLILGSMEYKHYYAFYIADDGYDEAGVYDGVSTLLVDKETGNCETWNNYKMFMASFFPNELAEAEKTYKKLNIRIRE